MKFKKIKELKGFLRVENNENFERPSEFNAKKILNDYTQLCLERLSPEFNKKEKPQDRMNYFLQSNKYLKRQKQLHKQEEIAVQIKNLVYGKK